MRIQSNRKSVYFFIALGACLVALAVALNVGWVVFHWRQVAMLVFGVIFFVLIIAGLVLNTIFLVREIRRNEQHNSFLNSVTHELKTPIASIRLYLETLQTRQVDEAKRQEFYQIMLDDCDRLFHTVEQALRASRTGHRRRHIQKTLIDLGELTRECLELARKRTHLTEKALRFVESLNRGEYRNERAMVLGDPDELRVAISNLIDNAIKYSDGKIDVSVEVASAGQKRVAVRVADRGIGVPPGELKRIFNRFYRAPRRVATRVKGAGLGLFIVRSIVGKHGGKTFAESEGEGMGSVFTIELPRVENVTSIVGDLNLTERAR
jgi:two-component system, OmpR family, sensor histidine kinase SenX3